MRVEVDKARRDGSAGRVDRLPPRGRRNRPDLLNSAACNSDVRPIPRIARAIDDHAVVNHHVVERLLRKRGRRRHQRQRRQNSNAHLFHTASGFARESLQHCKAKRAAHRMALLIRLPGCSGTGPGGRMRLVLRVMAASLLIVMAYATEVWAQTGFRNMFDHLHLAAPDPIKAVEWYRKN